MKKRMLLSTSLCYLIATAAMAAEAPVSSLQPTLTDKMSSASSVSDNNSVAKVTGPNTYTVEELYKNSAELNKKKVVVHGLAVKVTSGIMGKTWTHIQDGTGDKNNGTNDLICISAVYGTEVGKVVTVTGTAIFKPGSRYKLVIEDATIN
jgi:hypothetical protein